MFYVAFTLIIFILCILSLYFNLGDNWLSNMCHLCDAYNTFTLGKIYGENQEYFYNYVKDIWYIAVIYVATTTVIRFNDEQIKRMLLHSSSMYSKLIYYKNCIIN